MSKKKNKGKLIGKTFEMVNSTNHVMGITVDGQRRKIEFTGGIDQRENGFIGGKYYTTDPDEIKKHNLLPGLYNMGNTCFANSVL